ncbi:MAG TPA: methyltransferase domain-containing protein [Longimicrobiales bacterium]
MQTPEVVRAAYDAVAPAYAEQFFEELTHKPLDRELLQRFAQEVGSGEIYDLGCGPGQTTAFLAAQGAAVTGLDLSAGQIEEARRLRPDLRFRQGDMLALPLGDGAAAGVVAFYAIVHFTMEQLRRALAEMHRVLVPGGRLLLAFHAGSEVVHVDEFLGRSVSLDFAFFDPDDVAAELARAGFRDIEVQVRDPYVGFEHPCRRAYVKARRPGAAPGLPAQD